MSIEIRTWAVADAPEVEAIHAEAFGEHGSVVVPLLRDLQKGAAAAAKLGLVAVSDGEIVAHVHFSRGLVDAPQRLIEVSVLSPIAVRPRVQSRGIGGELIREGLRMLEQRGIPAVFLEGPPLYYRRFGFRAAEALGFRRPSLRIPDAAFQVVVLGGSSGEVPSSGELHSSDGVELSGTLVYDHAFWDHDAVGLRD